MTAALRLILTFCLLSAAFACCFPDQAWGRGVEYVRYVVNPSRVVPFPGDNGLTCGMDGTSEEDLELYYVYAMDFPRELWYEEVIEWDGTTLVANKTTYVYFNQDLALHVVTNTTDGSVTCTETGATRYELLMPGIGGGDMKCQPQNETPLDPNWHDCEHDHFCGLMPVGEEECSRIENADWYSTDVFDRQLVYVGTAMYSVETTSDGCAMLDQFFTMEANDQSMWEGAHAYLYDFAAGLPSESIFIPPPECESLLPLP